MNPALPDQHTPKRGFIGREWLIQAVRSKLGQAGLRWLVVVGKPGAGKSAFARQFAASQVVQAAHYSQVTAGGSINPTGFVRSLSTQLSESLPEFSRFVLEGEPLQKVISRVAVEQVRDQARVYGIYIENFLMETRDPADAFDYLVREPLVRMEQAGRLDGNITLLVDGLDEAARYENPPTILDLVRRASDLPEQVRWLLTSRPEDFLKTFAVERLTIEDYPKNNLDDIRKYIARELSKDELKVPGNTLELAKSLETRSQGNFLYLEYVFKHLYQLAEKSLPLSTPAELPEGLEGVYRKFLDRLVKDTSRSEWRSLYRPVLASLSIARQPLNFEQIVHFSAADPQDVQDTLTDLEELISPPKPAGEPTYSVYHISFSDFLTNRDHNPSHWIDPVQAHRQIVHHYLEKPPPDWRVCDRYGLLHLPAHLAAGDQLEELASLLLDYGWLRAKFEACGVNDMLQDYAFLPGNLAARRVEAAVRLAAHVLVEDGSQLAPQLFGRLMGFEDPQIQQLLEDTVAKTEQPWLRPLVASLEAPGGPLMFTLTGHTSTVLDVELSPDGRQAATVSRDGTLAIWDLEAGSRQSVSMPITYRSGGLVASYSVIYAPDGRKVFSGADDNTIRAWDSKTATILFTLKGHTASVRALAITQDGSELLSLADNGELFLWDLDRQAILQKLKLTGIPNPAVVISPKGSQVLVSSGLDAVLVDLNSFEVLQTLPGEKGDHEEAIIWMHASQQAIAWLPNGRQALLASGHGMVVLWDVTAGERLGVMASHTSGVNGLAISLDGALAISASDDRSVIVWDLAHKSLLRRLVAHSDDVKSVRLTPDGQRLVTVSSDTTLKVWDFQQLRAYQSDETDPTHQSLWLGPDGRRAVRINEHAQVELCDLETSDSYSLGPAAQPTQWAAFTPDGNRALLVDRAGKLSAWDLDNVQPLASLPDHPGAVMTAIAADGRHGLSLATRAQENSLQVWDLESGQLVCQLQAEVDWIGDLAISPDGRRAVFTEDEAFQAWDLENGVQLIRLTQRTFEEDFMDLPNRPIVIIGSWGPWAAAVTPDARRVVYAPDDGSLRVFDVSNMRPVFFRIFGPPNAEPLLDDEPPNRTLSLGVVAINAGGDRVAAAYQDFVQVFDVEGDVELTAFRVNHRRPVSGLALSPAGDYLASVAGERGLSKYGGRADTSLKIWDLGQSDRPGQTPVLLASFTGENNLKTCAFPGDGRIVQAGPHWLRLENFKAV